GTTEMLARPAPRPSYSALATERAPGRRLPGWHSGLASYLAERARAGTDTANAEADTTDPAAPGGIRASSDHRSPSAPSEKAAGDFIQTDVFGAFVLLDAARSGGIRHLQVSTDEVYGSIEDGSFTESSPLAPSSPYSASKAGGDLLVGAFHRTYDADALLVRA